MKQSTISTSLRTLSLVCLIGMPMLVSAYCPRMGGYPSYEAQARAQAAQRAQASAQSAQSVQQIASAQAQVRDRQAAASREFEQSRQIKSDQESLKRLGYYKGDIDGRPNAAFEASVTQFRKANGLIAGTTLDVTSREILKGGKVVTEEQHAVAQKRMEELSADQKAMADLGYYTAEIDGRNIAALETSVAYFRKVNGLENGLALDAASRGLIQSGKAITKAQSMQILTDQTTLRIRGYYKGPVDGRPGPAMETAVAEFRKANGLNEGTALDATSRDVLNNVWAVSRQEWESRIAATAPAEEAQSLAKPEVGGTTAALLQSNRGILVAQRADKVASGAPVSTSSPFVGGAPDDSDADRKEALKADQKALALLGFYQGNIDGLPGPRTNAAILKFKKQHGLDARDATLDAKARIVLTTAQASLAGR